jgi:hypothetical protein
MRGSFAALAIVHVLWPADARAGCPNVCELAGHTAEVAPALACLTVQASPQTCDCGVRLTLKNTCSDGVDAVGFVLAACGRPGATPGELQRDCTTVPAGFEGWLEVAAPHAEGTGAKEKRLALRRAGVEHTLTSAFRCCRSMLEAARWLRPRAWPARGRWS